MLILVMSCVCCDLCTESPAPSCIEMRCILRYLGMNIYVVGGIGTTDAVESSAAWGVVLRWRCLLGRQTELPADELSKRSKGRKAGGGDGQSHFQRRPYGDIYRSPCFEAC